MWPQITYVLLTALGLGIAMASHGQPREPVNFWNTLISTAIVFWLLSVGGFFDVIIYISGHAV